MRWIARLFNFRPTLGLSSLGNRPKSNGCNHKFEEIENGGRFNGAEQCTICHTYHYTRRRAK